MAQKFEITALTQGRRGRTAARRTAGALVMAIGLGIASAGGLQAAEGAKEPIDVDWSFEGIFGNYDRGALQRGYKVYKEVCASCHGLRLLSFRNLGEPGGPEFTEGQVKAIAAEYTVMDGPNEDGDMVERPAIPSDRFVSPFPNDNAARAANGGALPPDMSVITKARPNGADYLYSLLVGYQEPPEGEEVREGLYYNPYFPGHQIAMPPPLSDGSVDYDDDTPNDMKQLAHDVTAFLMWAAEPKLEERKQTGFWFILYLAVLAGLLYFATRKLWAPVKH